MNVEPMYLTIFLIAGGIIFLVLFFHYVPFFLWLSAKVSGVNISLVQLFLMRIRNVPPYIIVPGMIEAHKAGLSNITRDELEAHYLAGGHVERVVHALVSASKANIELPFQMATAIDLAGRDVFEAVQMSVNPKVINTPPVAAVAKDGIQLIAKARVTVRANIKQLVGGAGEETVDSPFSRRERQKYIPTFVTICQSKRTILLKNISRHIKINKLYGRFKRNS